MAGFNLADILAQAGEMQSIIRGDTKKAEQTQEQTQALREEQVQSAKSMSDLSVDQARIEGNQKLQLEARKKATMDTFGVDILDPENRIAYLAREQAAAVDESIANSKRAAALRNTSLYDSPLEYLMARPFASRNDLAAENATQRAVVIDKAIDDLNSQVQSTSTTNKAVQEAWTVDQQTNHLSQVALTAADAVRTLKINQNTALISDLKVLRDMKAEDIKNSTSAYVLKRQAEQFDAMRAEAQQRTAMHKDAKVKEKASANEQLALYNLGADIVGKSKIHDPVEFERMLKGPMKDIIAKVMSKGMETGLDLRDVTPQVSQRIMIAPTPGESVVALGEVKGSLGPSAERVSALLSAAQQSTLQRLRGASTTAKITKDDLAVGVNRELIGGFVPSADGKGKTAVVGVIASMQANVEQDAYGGKIRNIYSIPSPETVATSKPELVAAKGWDAIVVPATNAAPNGQPKASHVMKQAQLAVLQGALSINEAADFVHTYYSAGSLATSVAEQHARVGIPPIQSYNVLIDSAGGLKKINMFDEARIKHALMSTTLKGATSNVK